LTRRASSGGALHSRGAPLATHKPDPVETASGPARTRAISALTQPLQSLTARAGLAYEGPEQVRGLDGFQSFRVVQNKQFPQSPIPGRAHRKGGEDLSSLGFKLDLGLAMETGQITKPHFSIPSIVAIVAAIISLFTGAFWGFILAIIAIVCGIVGSLMAMSPSIRGGIISVLSLVLAAIGIILAIVRAVGWAAGKV